MPSPKLSHSVKVIKHTSIKKSQKPASSIKLPKPIDRLTLASYVMLGTILTLVIIILVLGS